VVTLLGKGGIHVSGVPVRHARLEPGDELRVGQSTIRIRQAARVRVGLGTADFESSPAPRLPWRAEPADEGPEPADVAPPSFVWHAAADDAEEFVERGSDADPRWAGAGSRRDTYGDPEPEFLESFSGPEQRGELDHEALAALSARERRASCRYEANGAGVLSWWEPLSASPVVLAAPAPKDEPGSVVHETVYARIMGRFAGAPRESASARAAAELARDPLPPLEGSMCSRTSPARLLDISQTGVLVLCDALPPANVRVWLRLETPQVSDWVEVIPRGTTSDALGGHRLRLAFRESCPYDIFKAVVYKKPAS
jgi:hypothetical protein